MTSGTDDTPTSSDSLAPDAATDSPTLVGKRWVQRKHQAAIRDGYRCTVCGSDDDLTVIMADVTRTGNLRRSTDNLTTRCSDHDEGRPTGPVMVITLRPQVLPVQRERIPMLSTSPPVPPVRQPLPPVRAPERVVTWSKPKPKTKLAALDRDYRKCTVCGAGGKGIAPILLVPVEDGGTGALANLATRCPVHNEGRPLTVGLAPDATRTAAAKAQPKCECVSHVGDKKELFATRQRALGAALGTARKFGLTSSAYRCPTGPGWHVRTKRAPKVGPVPRSR